MTVTCNGISDGSPHFQWLIFDREKQNMTVLKPKLKEHEYVFPSKNNKWHGVKLFLPNVSSADQREYTCMAGNNMGYDYKTFYLHVLKRKQTSGMLFNITLYVALLPFCYLLYFTLSNAGRFYLSSGNLPDKGQLKGQ